jgi:hypothetical protein
MLFDSSYNARLRDLKKRLKQENPILTEVVDSFRDLDQVSRRLGLFRRDESFATRTPWWPMISILGLYSSGKSTFINHYLKYRLQSTGNQAVDDKFTVICYTDEKKARVLPGVALDADPRFPFYKISQAIEEVAHGEGRRVDAYIQLKTCPSEKLRGKILIDSPGFDADAQRNSTLRITDRIIDLSDLVLVFFDARHPESGSMKDTLNHLVSRTIQRHDSNKFLYILNQIDTTAVENNIEEVFAAWQRALAQFGLTAGRCYAIYVPEAATPIKDPQIRARLEGKCDQYLKSIYRRLEQVGVERAYRIAGILEDRARMLRQDVVPLIEKFMTSWRRHVLWLDGAVFGTLLSLFLFLTIKGGYWQGLSLNIPLLEKLPGGATTRTVLFWLLVAGLIYLHLRIRRWAAKRVSGKMLAALGDVDMRSNYRRAFQANSRWYRPLFAPQPRGWSKNSAEILERVLQASNVYIQKLNDMYTNPSGETEGQPPAEEKPVAAEAHPPVPTGTDRQMSN